MWPLLLLGGAAIVLLGGAAWTKPASAASPRSLPSPGRPSPIPTVRAQPSTNTRWSWFLTNRASAGAVPVALASAIAQFCERQVEPLVQAGLRTGTELRFWPALAEDGLRLVQGAVNAIDRYVASPAEQASMKAQLLAGNAVLIVSTSSLTQLLTVATQLDAQGVEFVFNVFGNDGERSYVYFQRSSSGSAIHFVPPSR